MFPIRSNEPDYALLKDPSCHTHNRYGKPIETVPQGHQLRGNSLKINGCNEVGMNPNRYKQHGFFFNADNCIACHACEAACSEKNDNPAHIAFRSVGFVEGGVYPNMQRMNISMACNHCDNPVCLKGCPTRAYTKFAEYGAVLQDPDICFGCGYCTWVCPYNAPQLDPVKGQVTKCNMCVDRLEVGLKPACVSACLGKALDFGVIENIPEGRTQCKTEIPGFPRTDITHPNIRFQQTRVPQRDMMRLDSVPLKYHRDDANGGFRPEVDAKHGFTREWNLGKLLGSHENAHIAFTLSVQTVMGAFLLMMLGSLFSTFPMAGFASGQGALPALGIMLALMGFGLFKLNMHLGKPHRFYRGFNNLRHSPVSREIAGVSLFFAGLAGFSFCALLETFDVLPLPDWLPALFATLGLLGAGFGGYYMYKLYRIPARPFWNHWHTGAAFAGTALSLGSLLLALVALVSGVLTPGLGKTLAGIALLGLFIEGIGLVAHARDLQSNGDEGAVSFYEQTTTHGNAYWLRNGLLAVAMLLSLGLVLFGGGMMMDMVLFGLLTLLALASAILGRALFYVIVIPTTMPGAFFWKNKGFVEHAREAGLANMPQLGVVYEQHHAFRMDELMKTLTSFSIRKKMDAVRQSVSGAAARQKKSGYPG